METAVDLVSREIVIFVVILAFSRPSWVKYN
jgi:hypothetical protein